MRAQHVRKRAAATGQPTAPPLRMRRPRAVLHRRRLCPDLTETEFGAPELKQVRQALDYILSQQEEPLPAAAVDRRWNLLQANEGTVRLFEFLVGPLAPGAKINLAAALVAPDVLRPYLTNWPDRALLHPQR
jgi:hypothetical protein